MYEPKIHRKGGKVNIAAWGYSEAEFPRVLRIGCRPHLAQYACTGDALAGYFALKLPA